MIAYIEHYIQQAEGCTSCLSVSDVVTKTGSMPCHKENLNFRRLKSSKMFFAQSENNLDINSREITRKSQIVWKCNFK